MGLVNDVCGQLFTVLEAQLFSPLTVTPRVSVCSNALSSANYITFSHNIWMLQGFPYNVVWLELGLLKGSAPKQPPSRLATLLLPSFEKVCAVYKFDGLLDLTRWLAWFIAFKRLFFSLSRLCTTSASVSVCMISQSWKIHTYFLEMVHHIPKVYSCPQLYGFVEA